MYCKVPFVVVFFSVIVLLPGKTYAQSPEDVGRDLILRSQQAALENDVRRATRLLYRGLTYPLAETLLDSMYVDVRDIASQRDRDAYKESDDKPLFFRRFWRALDPTPATPENERYVEHNQRLDYARKHYAATLSRGYDDRGMIYVRYGPPGDRFIGPGDSFTRPSESWFYGRLGNVNFDFIEFGANFRLESDFQKALIAVPADERDRARMLRDIFAPRAELGLAYSRMQNQFDSELQSVDEGGKPFDPQFVPRLLNDYVSQSQLHQEALPTSTTDIDLEEQPVNFWVSYSRFHLNRPTARVELYFGVPLRNLVFRPDSGGLSTVLENDFRVENSRNDVVVQDRRQYPILAANRSEIDTVDYVGQLTLFLPPESYRIGFELRNPAGNKRQFQTLRLVVPSVDQNRLSVSDVEFAELISSARGERHPVNRGFLKGEFYVEPYPYVYVPRDKDLSLYFEVYNLQMDGAGKTEYRVEYEIVGEESGSRLLSILSAINPFKKGERTSSSTTHDRQGSAANEAEHIVFNTGQLSPGVYTLRVHVVDQTSGQEAETSRRFRLLE